MNKINRPATENYIKELLTDSELISLEEKSYWIDLLSVMTEEQLRKLINIIVLDKKEEIKEFNKLIMTNYENI